MKLIISDDLFQTASFCVSSECACLVKLRHVFSSEIQISKEHGFTRSLPKSVMSIGSCKGMSGTGTLVFPTRTFAGLRWCRSFLNSVCLKCEEIWVFRWPDVLNFLSQWGQAKGLTPAKHLKKKKVSLWFYFHCPRNVALEYRFFGIHRQWDRVHPRQIFKLGYLNTLELGCQSQTIKILIRLKPVRDIS